MTTKDTKIKHLFPQNPDAPAPSPPKSMTEESIEFLESMVVKLRNGESRPIRMLLLIEDEVGKKDTGRFDIWVRACPASLDTYTCLAMVEVAKTCLVDMVFQA